jgi:hypothetical protein
MQHTPHLSETLENLFKGKLKESSHAFLESTGPNAGLQRHVTSRKLGCGQMRSLLIIELNPDLKT